MNVTDYQTAGYGLSSLIAQPVITKAENDVIGAYIVPLIGHVPTTEEKATEPLKTAIMSLSFLLVQQRNIFATRAGAKTKNVQQSGTPTYEEVLQQNAPSCVRALCALNTGLNPVKECSDICGIFFHNNFFGSKHY